MTSLLHLRDDQCSIRAQISGPGAIKRKTTVFFHFLPMFHGASEPFLDLLCPKHSPPDGKCLSRDAWGFQWRLTCVPTCIESDVSYCRGRGLGNAAIVERPCIVRPVYPPRQEGWPGRREAGGTNSEGDVGSSSRVGDFLQSGVVEHLSNRAPCRSLERPVAGEGVRNMHCAGDGEVLKRCERLCGLHDALRGAIVP